MRNIRVIARLDVKGEHVINTIQFEGLRRVGLPNVLAKKYYEQGADEIIIVDQVASLYGRDHLAELTRKFSENVFVPMTVGGGIRTVQDARKLLRAGADVGAVCSQLTSIGRADLVAKLRGAGPPREMAARVGAGGACSLARRGVFFWRLDTGMAKQELNPKP